MERIETFDISRGIAIILVILGHMMHVSLIPSQWIFTFHMPFFFILSGMLYIPSKYNSLSLFVIKKTKTLFIPTLLLTLVLISITELLHQGYNIPHRFLSGDRLPIIWFLYALFFTELIYYFVQKISTMYRCLLLIASLLIGYTLSRDNITLPYNSENIFTSIFFYGISNTLFSIKNKRTSYIYKNTSFTKDGLASLGLIFPLLVVFHYRESFELSTNQIPSHIIPFIIAAFSASFSLIYFSARIKHNKMLAYIGQNTLLILILHSPIIGLASTYIRPHLTNFVFYKLIEFTFALGASLAIAPAVNTYIPWLVGKNK